jgi:hypothetical protein
MLNGMSILKYTYKTLETKASKIPPRMNPYCNSRRDFLIKLSAATALSAFPFSGFASGKRAEEYVTTDTRHGRIRGERVAGVNIFRGVPYGGKLSGDRRFRRPAELTPWSGVKDMLTLGAPAIQNPRRGKPDPSEDCLFLNVWTPANDNKKRAVMFSHRQSSLSSLSMHGTEYPSAHANRFLYNLTLHGFLEAGFLCRNPACFDL